MTPVTLGKILRMKIQHPLRYYLTKKNIDVGGQRVTYTPAHQTHLRLTRDGEHLLDIHIEGGYSLTARHGADVEVISKQYAGEIPDRLN